MLVKFNKEQIAALLKNASVQAGIDKESKSMKLPDMSTTNDVLEYIGSAILTSLVNRQ